MNEIAIKQYILKTLSYFDIFNYPLTKEELYYFLWQSPILSYSEFLLVLDKKENQEIEEKQGFYFLVNKDSVVEKRKQRLLHCESRLKKARRAVRLLAGVPFLRAVFVCNTVASGTAEEKSDIDFFIVAAPKRVWLVRFFSNLVLRMLGWRTYGDKTANRICLSFFVDEKHLDLAPWRTTSDDIHFCYWLAQMVPILDPNNLHERFIRVNQWIKPYLPHVLESNNKKYINAVFPGIFARIWQKIFETMWGNWYGDLLEKQSRDWQKMKMKLSLREKAEKGDHGVVLGEGIIKLHENDSRLSRKEEWENKINI